MDSSGVGADGNAVLKLPVLPPEDDALPGFPEAKRSKSKTWFPGGKRRRWKEPDGTIYEWDYENGRVEVYGRRGRRVSFLRPLPRNRAAFALRHRKTP